MVLYLGFMLLFECLCVKIFVNFLKALFCFIGALSWVNWAPLFVLFLYSHCILSFILNESLIFY